MSTELAATEPKSKKLAIQPQEPSVAGMLQAVIEKGVTPENVAALEQLVGLYERMQKRDAEKEFATAFVNLQREMPKIEATKGVPDKNGKEKYRFAPFEEIMSKLQPVLTANGFTVTFDSDILEERIVAKCTLMHVGGHLRTNSFAARIGSGPPNSSAAQADGAASTYAKRFALCNALNIVVEQEQMDDDARAYGSPMDEAKWKELEKRVTALGDNIDKKAFLQFAGAANCEGIPAEKYQSLDQMLFKKEVKAGLRDSETGDWKF